MKFIGSNSWHDTKDFINLISVFFPLSLSTIILSYDPFLRWCFYIFRLCEAECSTIKFRLSLEIFSSHRTSFYWKIIHLFSERFLLTINNWKNWFLNIFVLFSLIQMYGFGFIRSEDCFDSSLRFLTSFCMKWSAAKGSHLGWCVSLEEVLRLRFIFYS